MLDSCPLPTPELIPLDDLAGVAADVIVVGVSKDGVLSSTGKALDDSADGVLTRLLEQGSFVGKQGKSLMVAVPNTGQTENNSSLVLMMGIGDASAIDAGKLFDLSSAAIRGLTDQPRSCIVLTLAEWGDDSAADHVIAGAVFGCEGQAIYQSDPSITVPNTIGFTGVTADTVERGRVIGESINMTRRLVNEPAGVIYPESFAARVREAAEQTSLDVEVWNKDRLVAEGCRAMLAVGQGSQRSPCLVMMRYSGGTKGEAPIALVGKGVTFDSGGLSLKPSDGMVDMKCDMAGAATVVGVMLAIAKLELPVNVIGFCGLAENMVSGDSYKLGDVIETRSGKTIEILNTDAEGRVVLADTLDVAVQHQPAAIVDLATLTGACMVALGTEVAGLMSNDNELCETVRTAAEAKGEPTWQLPMFGLYDDKIKSKVADIKNVGEGRWGGAITAAKFLEQFVDETPWVHIDIAGPAFADSPKPHRDAGATGVMVRSLLGWIESRSAT